MNTINRVQKAVEAAVGSLWTDENGNTFMLAARGTPGNDRYTVINLATGFARHVVVYANKEEAVYGLTFISNNATITVS